VDDALAFFKAKPGLRRLLDGLVAKYRSLGRMAGKVTLKQLSETEANDLNGLFGSAFVAGDEAKIAFQAFVATLEASRFSEVSCLELLEAWAGEPLISNAEAKQRAQDQFLAQLDQMQRKFQHKRVSDWCKAVAKGHIKWRKSEDPQLMQQLCQALVMLPAEPTRLPVFAAQISGDPHALDLGRSLTTHFLIAVKWFDSAEDETALSETERITSQFERFNLIRDDIANFVTLTGLIATQAETDHPVWRAAAENNVVLNTPLRELLGLTSVLPYRKTPHVFVVENSTVFSALLDRFTEQSIPLICSHGQFKLAFLRLIDLLVGSGCQVHYSSDCDPEGLLMAQRLCQRHDQITPWRMHLADYQRSKSASRISETRLKKLQQINQPSLVETATAIAADGRAGYQESLLPELIADISRP
jgi:uncharacterized protein (TIGR02679 family)